LLYFARWPGSALRYLELDCGNVQKQNFAEIWENSKVFRNLRDLSNTAASAANVNLSKCVEVVGHARTKLRGIT